MKKIWLIFVFLVIALYYITGFFYTDPLLQRQINEEKQFHLPVIQHFSSFDFDDAIQDYDSATFPLYHLIFAFLYNLFNGNLTILHIINLMLTFLTAYLIYFYLKYLNPESKDLPLISIICSMVFLLSPYTRITALTLTTDNLPLLFIIIFLITLAKFRMENKIYFLFLAIFSAYLAFYTRQFYIWVVMVCFISLMTLNLKRYQMAIIALFNIIMILPALFLVLTWKGLVPPSFQELHQTSSNIGFSIPYFSMALLFYLSPYYAYRLRELLKKERNYSFIKDKIFLVIISSMVGYILYFFLSDFQLIEKGGGAAPKLIKIIFGTYADWAFILISSVGLIIIIDLIKDNFKNNYIWVLLILIFLPTKIFWQKYFDPLIILVFFLFTVLTNHNEFLKSKFIYLFPVLEILIYLSSFAYYSS